MELKIYSPQDAGFIQRIDWNFEELKSGDHYGRARSMKLLFTRMTRSRRQRLTGKVK